MIKVGPGRSEELVNRAISRYSLSDAVDPVASTVDPSRSVIATMYRAPAARYSDAGLSLKRVTNDVGYRSAGNRSAVLSMTSGEPGGRLLRIHS
jgi:hypothetical protein